MGSDGLPIASETVVLREEFADLAVLFNPDTGDTVGTNPVGVAVWNLMDGRNTIDDIVAELRRSFDGVSAAAPEEIRAFIDNLAQRGFVDDE